MNGLTFTYAGREYRNASGTDDYCAPDPVRSKRYGDVWRLRASDGALLALVHRDGRVMARGMHTTAEFAVMMR
jgi:hypothetical protein